MSFSDLALDHIARPRNRGEMPDADRNGQSGSPGEGPYVQIWLKLDGERIAAASYETNGCPSSVACASMVCELAKEREMRRLVGLEPKDLITVLGGLPEGKEMYASLAVGALRNALEDK